MVACDIASQVAAVPCPMGTPGDLSETVELIGKAGGGASAAITDVRDSQPVTELTERIVTEHGRLDILVANAGICSFKPVAELSDSTWRDTIETNLSGALYCIRAALPHMTRPRYCRVGAIAAGAARAGTLNPGHYAASKCGLIGLVKAVALETAKLGITANVVCPATVAAPMVLNDATFGVFRLDVEHPGITMCGRGSRR